VEQVARKGNVPPRHIHHREDETFYVIEGEMTFSVGDQTIKANSGHHGLRHARHPALIQIGLGAGADPRHGRSRRCGKFFKACSVPAPSMTLPPPAGETALQRDPEDDGASRPVRLRVCEAKSLRGRPSADALTGSALIPSDGA